MLDEVVAYRGYELVVCSAEGRGLWRVLVQARADVPAIFFFGGSATREKAIDEAKLRINEALECAHSPRPIGDFASPSGCQRRLKT